MIKLNIICQIHGTSGYVSHSKQLANALNKICDVKLSTHLTPGWELVTNDQELEMIKKKDDKDRINLIIDLPFNWKQHASKDFNIGFLVFEGDKIPLSWVQCISDPKITQVWVPSRHTYDAILNTQSDMGKVRIVPHGVDLSLFYPEDKPNRPFTFLVNKGFRNAYDRGGMQHAIKAFIEEFNKGEAKLVLKLNPAYAMHPENLISYINYIIKESGKTNEQIGEIMFNYDALPYESMKEVYNNSDVLLNPTEAEAFSLPCIEAMACKKPVITTNFGGQTDFVNESNGWLIGGELHEVRHEILYEGISWMKPNIAQLRKAMRECLTNKESYTQKAENALKQALNFQWSSSALKSKEYLSQVVVGILDS